MKNTIVQFSSVTPSCTNLGELMNCSMSLPVHHQLLEFTQTHVHSFLASPLYWGSPQCRAFLPLGTPLQFCSSQLWKCGRELERLPGRTTDFLTRRSSPRTSTPPVPRQLQQKPLVFFRPGTSHGGLYLFILTSPLSMWDLTCALCSGSSES